MDLSGIGFVETSTPQHILLIRLAFAAILGGAIGFFSPRTGVRFEVRHFRSLKRETDQLTGETSSLLSFWRITAGIVIKR